MTVYLIMLALVVVFSIFATEYSTTKTIAIGDQNNLQFVKQKKPNGIFVWLIFLCFAFVGVFRYGVGVDFFSYYKTQNWASRFQKGDYNDPGFTIFANLCILVFGEIEGAVTMGAAIVTIALFVFTIAKQSDKLTISLLLFIFIGCFTGMFNGVRQFLAAAILFAGYPYIVSKKIWKWLIVVALASSIHITAILMFFIYFACNLKCNLKLVVGYFLIAVVLLFLYEPLFDIVSTLKQEEVSSEYSYMTTRVNTLRVLVQCVPLLMFLFVPKKKINEDPECKFLFNICLLNSAIAVAAINSAYFSRFSIYTYTFQILMYPKILSRMTKQNAQILSMLLIVCYSIYWVYSIDKDSSLSVFRWIFPYLFS